jgi:hypothetical protein
MTCRARKAGSAKKPSSTKMSSTFVEAKATAETARVASTAGF